MNDITQLGVLKSLETLVKERMKEKRAEVDEQAKAAYLSEGITKRAIKLDGEKIGDYIVVQNKPSFEIMNQSEFEDFALTYGFASEKHFINPEYIERIVELVQEHFDPEEAEKAIRTNVEIDSNWRDFMTKTGEAVTFLDSGEIVPGVAYIPESYKGTQLRGCDPKDVFPIVQRLGGIDQLLLGDGNE